MDIKKLLNRETFFQLVRFGIVGVTVTLIHYGLYWLLKFVINYNVAYTIGYFTGFVFNYFLSSYFTFRKKANVKNGIGFGGAHICNYLIQLGLLNLFIYLGLSKDLAPWPTYCISIPVNFLMVRFVFNHFKK